MNNDQLCADLEAFFAAWTASWEKTPNRPYFRGEWKPIVTTDAWTKTQDRGRSGGRR
jgi:hypothetical protein